MAQHDDSHSDAGSAGVAGGWDDAFAKGTPVAVEMAPLSGPHLDQRPLNNQVVDFGS